jgi:ATP synthase protein I
MRRMTLERDPDSPGEMADAARNRQERQRRWRMEGEQSMLRFVGQIGVLGWMIVGPTLLGIFAGRWLDGIFGSGIFWSAALLVLGVTIGFWSAWNWMHRQ